eukprot:2803695-Alexandrium_andersonii.AAC.1
MERNHTKGVTAIMGDLNARFSEETVEDIVGPWHLRSVEQVRTEDEYTNAELLTEFCKGRDLVLPTTWKKRSLE